MKKLTLILALILSLNFASTVCARSRNSIQEGSVKLAGEPANASLIIRPYDEVPTGTSIEIEFDNAVVFSSGVINGTAQPNEKGYNSRGYQWTKNGAKWNTLNGFYDVIEDLNSEELPYKITRLNDYEIKVELCNIPKDYADEAYSTFNNDKSEYYYRIPLPVYVKTSDTVELTIKGKTNNDTINKTRHTFNVGADKVANKNSNSNTHNYTYTRTTENTTEATTENDPKLNRVEVTIGKSTIFVNSKPREIGVPAYIQSQTNSTLIPLRAVTVALANGNSNKEDTDIVSWDPITKTAIINYGNKKIEFKSGSEKMVVNGVEKTIMGGIPEITNGRMFVPFRVLGEELGAEVRWNSVAKTAVYN